MWRVWGIRLQDAHSKDREAGFGEEGQFSKWVLRKRDIKRINRTKRYREERGRCLGESYLTASLCLEMEERRL